MLSQKTHKPADESAENPLHKVNHFQLADNLEEVHDANLNQTQKDKKVVISKKISNKDRVEHSAEPNTLPKTSDDDVLPTSSDCPVIPCRKPTSLTDLPREIKDMVYHELFRPDAAGYSLCTSWPNALRCTKVLGLSRAIHAEAIKVLECLVPTIVLSGCKRGVFRSMVAHRTPNMYKSYSVHTSDYIPQPLTELFFVRLRKVEIAFRYPPKYTDSAGEEYYGHFEGQATISRLGEEVDQLLDAVRKSKLLVQLHFNVQSGRYEPICGEDGKVSRTQCTPTVNRDNSELIAMLTPLVVAGGRQGFRLTAESNKVFRVGKRDYIHRNSVAFLRAADSHVDPIAKFINDAAVLGLDGSPPQPALPHATLVEPDASAGPDFVKPFERVRYPQRQPSYALQPECRQSYAVFREPADLAAHLARHPQHAVRFAKRAYNELNKRHATAEVQKNKCRTCGIWFDRLDPFDKHCAKYQHTRTRRQGIVPRWKKDNGWFRCGTDKI